MASLRIVFFGTAELACASLAALANQPDFQMVGVVSQPDRPRGRNLKLQPTPVKALAKRRGLLLWQPERARHESFVRILADLRLDLIVVAAYGQILPACILELPRFGCLNVHASLLPKYRGAAPMQWAILNGESETGVTIMRMDAGLDTGDILAQQATVISPADDSRTLHDRLSALGAQLLVRTIPEYVAGKTVPCPQRSEGASYARKIVKQDGCLDWRQPAAALWNRIRALIPWPGAFTQLRIGSSERLLKIWQAQVIQKNSGQSGQIIQADKAGIVIRCGQEALQLLSLQLEGGRRLSAQEFLSGHRLIVGEQLGGIGSQPDCE